MKKGLLICCIILLLLFTYCNIVQYIEINKEWQKAKAELEAVNQRYIELIELKYAIIASDDIFRYIHIKNPALSNREISDIVSHAFYLGDLTGADPYGILTIMDIESDFNPEAVGKSHGEMGPMQLLPENWDKFYQQYGFNYEDKKNWKCTSTVAAGHFRWLIKKHKGNVIAAIGEYNAGKHWATNESAHRHIDKFKVAYKKIVGYREPGKRGL